MVQYELFSVSLDLLKDFCAVVTDLLGKIKTYDYQCQATSLEFQQQQGQCTKSPISSFHVRKQKILGSAI